MLACGSQCSRRRQPDRAFAIEKRFSTLGYVQTRYLILASLVTGLAILIAAALWFSGI